MLPYNYKVSLALGWDNDLGQQWMKQSNQPEAAIVGGTQATHYALEDEPHFSNRLQVANSISEQIWREQTLVSTRMQWNFTFQAFLAGIYVFAGSSLDGWTKVLVQTVLALEGLCVSLFCLLGAIAAQRQSTRLKIHWMNEFHPMPPKDPGECNIVRGAYPQPFSDSKGSKIGRFASRGVCIAIMAMWLAMISITLITKLVFANNNI